MLNKEQKERLGNFFEKYSNVFSMVELVEIKDDGFLQINVNPIDNGLNFFPGFFSDFLKVVSFCKYSYGLHANTQKEGRTLLEFSPIRHYFNHLDGTRTMLLGSFPDKAEKDYKEFTKVLLHYMKNYKKSKQVNTAYGRGAAAGALSEIFPRLVGLHIGSFLTRQDAGRLAKTSKNAWLSAKNEENRQERIDQLNHFK